MLKAQDTVHQGKPVHLMKTVSITRSSVESGVGFSETSDAFQLRVFYDSVTNFSIREVF